MSFLFRSRPVPTHNFFSIPIPPDPECYNFFQSRSRGRDIPIPTRDPELSRFLWKIYFCYLSNINVPDKGPRCILTDTDMGFWCKLFTGFIYSSQYITKVMFYAPDNFCNYRIFEYCFLRKFWVRIKLCEFD
jgi:hypothetical protein